MYKETLRKQHSLKQISNFAAEINALVIFALINQTQNLTKKSEEWGIKRTWKQGSSEFVSAEHYASTEVQVQVKQDLFSGSTTDIHTFSIHIFRKKTYILSPVPLEFQNTIKHLHVVSPCGVIHA